MTERTPSPASRIASGASAGLIAGLAASLAVDLFQRATQPSRDDGEPATEKAADGIAGDVTGEPLSDHAKPLGGQLVHYGLGAALGVGYGIAAEIAPAVTTGFGTTFAPGMWATLDEAAVPALRLGGPPWKASPATQAIAFASHLVFGVAAEMAGRIARRAIAQPSSTV